MVEQMEIMWQKVIVVPLMTVSLSFPEGTEINQVKLQLG
jgi:hypothetical protein